MMALPPRPARSRASTTSARIAAPLGGLNTVAAGGAMPDSDCIYIYNLIAAEYGLRSRLGFEEWVTGLGGEVRSILPFSGSAQNGSGDRLFAVTPLGITDVSASTATPGALDVAFGVTSNLAGVGSSTAVTTPAGHFLLYCDEENGHYRYSEATTSWTKVLGGTTVLWAPSTPYEVGDHVVNGPNEYVVTTAGTSAASGGPTGGGSGIADGSVVWDFVAVAVSGAIGPSLADERAGLTADPDDFVFVTVWKNRVFFVEKDSSRGWYLDVNAISGTATSFDFGIKMQHGGPLVGLYNWSYDGGSGMDTLLVAISAAGDIAIYQGTDPASSSTFGLKGCWYLGAVPSGRRIATDYGGELLVMCTSGIVPLSRLVVGRGAFDASLYATQKIANLFSALASTYRTLYGWGIHIHPTDNALLVTVPNTAETSFAQLAMAFSTKGWSQYRGVPIHCAAIWQGRFYFGTANGRVCVNEGYVDEVTLAAPGDFLPVDWSLLTAYQDLDNARQKRVQLLRPSILSETPDPIVEAIAKYGYDISEPAPPAGAVLASSATWDNALWDVDLWAGSYVPGLPLQGAQGIGREVAIALRGQAVSRTILTDIAIFFDQGGLL